MIVAHPRVALPLIILAVILLTFTPLSANTSASPKNLTSAYKKTPAKKENKASQAVKKEKSASSPQRKSTKAKAKAKAKTKTNTNTRKKQSAKSSTPKKHFTAKSAVILDGATGEILYSHAPDTPGQPASTIKILTAQLALESLDNHAMVQVSSNAAGMPRSKIYLQPGKSYPASDLINAALLASANDACVALAEKIGGEEERFASRMTRLARDLGARQTICKTASGLTAQGQQTTARDLATVFNRLMKKQEFVDRISQVTAPTSFGKTLRSHNKALWRVSGAVGGKTGYTNAARQTYVGKFRRNNEEIVVAILGSETMWNDISHLVERGFSMKQKGKTSSARAAELEIRDPLGTKTSDRVELQVLTDLKKTSKL